MRFPDRKHQHLKWIQANVYFYSEKKKRKPNSCKKKERLEELRKPTHIQASTHQMQVH